MKKSILSLVSAIFAISCLFFTSCELTNDLKVNIKIVNTTDVDLNIASLDLYIRDTNMATETLEPISPSSTKEKTITSEETTIPKKSESSTPSITIKETLRGLNGDYYYNYGPNYYIKINCSYQTSSGIETYPYIGLLNGSIVSIEKGYGQYYNTSECYVLNEDNLVLNFVKTDDGKYVLCVVE